MHVVDMVMICIMQLGHFTFANSTKGTLGRNQVIDSWTGWIANRDQGPISASWGHYQWDGHFAFPKCRVDNNEQWLVTTCGWTRTRSSCSDGWNIISLSIHINRFSISSSSITTITHGTQIIRYQQWCTHRCITWQLQWHTSSKALQDEKEPKQHVWSIRQQIQDRCFQ